MRAVVQDRYGPPSVLRIAEVERPRPKDDQVLIHVRASTVSQTDAHGRAANPFFWRLFAGLRRPRWQSLGVELAGEVEAAGSAVTKFKVGDRVFGQPPGFGAHAEYICVSERAPIALMPAGMRFEEAAAVCDGAFQALSALRVAEVGEGRRIVVYGASGSLGTSAVQLAKHFGADVIGVCNTKNVELVRSLGADEVVDYLNEDFTKLGQSYDAIIDAVGKYAFLRGRRSLRPGGIFVATDFGRSMIETIVVLIASRWIGSRRMRFATGGRSQQDAEFMRQLIEAGEYRPVIDRTYPLDQVAEAHAYVETWQKAGNVVLLVSGEAEA
ncbi:MAG: NAD(P)-dependent alcohol dehydrogenase [Chloroflexi bacterium]|nr:NAD(P)-dependent alcohol dehydrogenase [Chloroflexota bacterium]